MTLTYSFPLLTLGRMTLREEFEITGNWLFRWRSYVPLVLFIPLLVEMRNFDWPMHSHWLQEVWELMCLAVAFCGLAVRVLVVGHTPARTSGRGTREQVADTLNTTGMYSIVRHPLYLGNFLMWMGIALFCLDWRLLFIYVLAFWLYYERIMFAEEEFLRRQFGQQFLDWASQTPTFIPKLWGWQQPSLPFSWRNVLKREYTGLFMILFGFFALDAVEHFVMGDRPMPEPHWVMLLIAGAIIYVVLRTMKKWTTLLDVDGR